MTVKELIQKLLERPMDDEVCIEIDRQDRHEIDDVAEAFGNTDWITVIQISGIKGRG